MENLLIAGIIFTIVVIYFYYYYSPTQKPNKTTFNNSATQTDELWNIDDQINPIIDEVIETDNLPKFNSADEALNIIDGMMNKWAGKLNFTPY